MQGVGFRWAVEACANSLGITGWVRNCPDGMVEAVCEGEEKRINSLMDSVKSQMQRYIRSVKVEWEEPRGEFSTFSIKFFGA